jgi:hypothetical protein
VYVYQWCIEIFSCQSKLSFEPNLRTCVVCIAADLIQVIQAMHAKLIEFALQLPFSTIVIALYLEKGLCV